MTEAVVLASARGCLFGYSCGSAPDLNRLRHCALASKRKGTSVACPFTGAKSTRRKQKNNNIPADCFSRTSMSRPEKVSADDPQYGKHRHSGADQPPEKDL